MPLSVGFGRSRVGGIPTYLEDEEEKRKRTQQLIDTLAEIGRQALLRKRTLADVALRGAQTEAAKGEESRAAEAFPEEQRGKALWNDYQASKNLLLPTEEQAPQIRDWDFQTQQWKQRRGEFENAMLPPEETWPELQALGVEQEKRALQEETDQDLLGPSSVNTLLGQGTSLADLQVLIDPNASEAERAAARARIDAKRVVGYERTHGTPTQVRTHEREKRIGEYEGGEGERQWEDRMAALENAYALGQIDEKGWNARREAVLADSLDTKRDEHVWKLDQAKADLDYQRRRKIAAYNDSLKTGQVLLGDSLKAAQGERGYEQDRGFAAYQDSLKTNRTLLQDYLNTMQGEEGYRRDRGILGLKDTLGTRQKALGDSLARGRDEARLGIQLNNTLAEIAARDENATDAAARDAFMGALEAYYKETGKPEDLDTWARASAIGYDALRELARSGFDMADPRTLETYEKVITRELEPAALDSLLAEQKAPHGVWSRLRGLF